MLTSAEGLAKALPKEKEEKKSHEIEQRKKDRENKKKKERLARQKADENRKRRLQLLLSLKEEEWQHAKVSG